MQWVQSAGGANSNDGVLLHLDMVYEILLRIPARQLCRFRAVCKPWLSLLTDPPFVAAHAARHRGDPLFAVAIAGKVAEVKLLDTCGRAVKQVSVGPRSSLRQMRTHLDLVLLHGVAALERKALRLLDPATGAISSLPNRNGSLSCSFMLGRAVSSTGEHGKYKVLSINSCSYATQPCKVLTVGGGNGTWRARPTPPAVRIKAFDNGTVVANGVIYHHVDNAYSWRVAAFDLEAEQWRPSLIQGPVPVPSNDGHAQPRRSLAQLNGRLAAVSTAVSTMDIWLLMGTNKWSKQCIVRTSSIEQHVWPSAMDAQPLSVLDDGSVALWVRTEGMLTGALWMYHPRTGTCTEVAAMENCLNVEVGVYTGNLLL
ncbi:unnamed protein product [Urochloa humidicola]